MTTLDGAVTDEAANLEDKLRHASALLRDDSSAASHLLAGHLAEATQRQAMSEVAEYAYLLARASMLHGDLNQALSLIDTARGAWIDEGEQLKAARTDLGRMNVLDDLGEHERAIEVGHQLLDQLDESSVDPDIVWLRAAGQKNLGISHGYLGRHREALAAYADAEALYRSIGELDDMALAKANRGVELLEIGDVAASIQTLREAAIALDEQGNTLYVARCLAYEGKAQLRRGDFLASFAAIDRAAQLLKDRETTVELARLELIRADTLRALNMLDDAGSLYARVSDFFAEEDLAHDHAAAIFGHAMVQALKGPAAGAAASFELAAELFRTVGDEGHAALADLGRSELLDRQAAQALVSDTLPRLQSSSRPVELGASLLRCAQLENDDSQALSLLDQVATLLDENDLPHLRWRQLHERGRRLRAGGRATEALAAFSAAIDAIDAIRSTIGRDTERLPFMMSRDVVQTDIVSLLLDLDRVDDAYDRIQRARSRTLVEVMSGEIASAHSSNGSTELDELYNKLLRASSAETELLQQNARAIEAQRTTKTKRIEAERQAEPARSLSATVVTYQVLDGHVVGFVRRDGSIRVVRDLTTIDHLQFLQARLDAQWRRFDDQGLAARQQSHLLSAVIEVLQQLHISLVARLDILDSDAVIIIPHGSMANLPFGAFHDGTCHLIERMPVTIAPSEIAAQRSQARSQARSGNSRLVVGVETPETPAVAIEVAALAGHPDTTTLTGDAATVGQFLHASRDHDVLHIASHGIHRPDSPLFSAVQFADRWLTAGELSGAQLDGQLVVLSACSSGRQGDAMTSNEIDGLPRALLAAGAGAVAVNLWAVDDQAASSLMKRFHQHLATASPAEALRAAQCETMTSTPHPYYWGSTVIIGAPQGPKDSL